MGKIRRDNLGNWYCVKCGEIQKNYGGAMNHLKLVHSEVDKVYTEEDVKKDKVILFNDLQEKTKGFKGGGGGGGGGGKEMEKLEEKNKQLREEIKELRFQKYNQAVHLQWWQDWRLWIGGSVVLLLAYFLGARSCRCPVPVSSGPGPERETQKWKKKEIYDKGGLSGLRGVLGLAKDVKALLK